MCKDKQIYVTITVRFPNISCIIILSINSSYLSPTLTLDHMTFFLLNNIKFSEALFFRLSGGLFRIWIHNIPPKIKTSRRSCQFTTILKNDFVSVGGITAFVWSKVQTEFDWRIHRKSKAIFSHWSQGFFFSKIAFYEYFWGNICGGFVWAKTALVALQKLMLKQSSMYIITNQSIDIALMRKNKNVVFFKCSRPLFYHSTGLQSPEMRILIIF